jgi:hypothetical protein
MLTISRFRPVTMGDREVFSRYYAQYPPEHSDNLFSNIACWNHFAHYTFAEHKGCLVISSTVQGTTTFRPPIGPRDREVLLDVIELAVREGGERPLVLVDEPTTAWIKSLFVDLPLMPDRDYWEYVYLTRDLAHLSGGKYLSIRRQLNRFVDRCHHTVEKISPENLSDVRTFLHEWCEWKQCNDHPFLSYEKDAVLFAIDKFCELGLEGLAIRVGEKIGAIAIFEELNQETAVVHFEKGLPDCEGIYKAINAETARFLEHRYTYINRESDMGVPGLREAKMRYHPHHMVKVFSVAREDLARLT